MSDRNLILAEADTIVWFDKDTGAIILRPDPEEDSYFSFTPAQAVGLATNILMAAYRALTTGQTLQ